MITRPRGLLITLALALAVTLPIAGFALESDVDREEHWRGDWKALAAESDGGFVELPSPSAPIVPPFRKLFPLTALNSLTMIGAATAAPGTTVTTRRMPGARPNGRTSRT